PSSRSPSSRRGGGPSGSRTRSSTASARRPSRGPPRSPAASARPTRAADPSPRWARPWRGGPAPPRGAAWARGAGGCAPRAGGPEDAGTPPPLSVAEAEARSANATSIVEPVQHHGEFLGALSIAKRPGDAVTPTEERLVHDLAAQAGLVLRNVQ